MAATEQVTRLAEPICADLGVELYDVEHKSGTVRVTVDRDGGVDIDTISLLTRELSRALDHDDPLPGRYTLEVSSPGLERQLRRPDHFAKAHGSTVKVKTKPQVEGDRRAEGVLVASDGETFTIEVDGPLGERRRYRYDDIDSVRTVFVWGPTPKPGSKPSGSKPSGSKPSGSKPGSIKKGSTKRSAAKSSPKAVSA